jgi:hypothetical protein
MKHKYNQFKRIEITVCLPSTMEIKLESITNRIITRELPNTWKINTLKNPWVKEEVSKN